MATIIIPVTTDPFQSFRIRLDGVDYLISLAYNQRENRFYLSLADDEENPIVSGIKVLANFPMLFRYRFLPAVPPGEIMAIDTTGDGTPPGLGELGEGLRCQLTYFDAAEVVSWKPAPPPPPVTISIYVAIRITVASAYIGDSNFATEFATAFAAACNTQFGSASSVAASAMPALAGPYGAITGVAIGQFPPTPGPVSVSTDVIQLFANQRPFFSASNISVTAV